MFAAAVVRDQSQIFSTALSGRSPAQLTFGNEGASAPLPSPDGRHVLFQRAGAIWVMRANGAGQRMLVARGDEPAWAPDSHRIAYVDRSSQNDPLGLRVVGVEGTGRRMLVSGRDVGDPAWSGDGRSLAFVRGGLLVVRRAGVERTLIANPPGVIVRIEWSADGRWLAFDYEDQHGLGLGVVRANGRDRRELHGIESDTAVWSPARALLAYEGYDDDPGRSSFRLLNPISGHIRPLAPAPSSINSLTWAPSGTSLAFSGGSYDSEDLTADSQLGTVDLAGHIHYLDPRGLYPLPEAVAWTAPPPGLHYRPRVPVGPLVMKDELEFRVPVDELAADGDRVAYRTCATIGVWQGGAANVVAQQVDRPLCIEGNISFYSLALAGNQIAWGVLRGGNEQFNSLDVQTVGTAGPQTTVAAHSQLTGDARGDERAGEFLGAGSDLVFSTWSFCDEVIPVACPNVSHGQATTVGAQTLWRVRDSSWPGGCPASGFVSPPNGRCQQLRAELGPLRVLDVDAGRIVASGDNATLVLDADGRLLLSIPVSTAAAQLAGSDLVVLVPGALRDYDATTGVLLHSRLMPDVSFAGVCGVPRWQCGAPHLRLEGAARGLVAYVLDGKLHLLRLRDGVDTTVGEASDAALDDKGLFYSYTTNGLWPGRIRFVPFDQLPFR